ncbi:MAG: collagen-like protein, partial [Bacteroidota bacterium]
TGATGATGAQGPAGPTGPQGPAGDPATDDQDLSLVGDILSLTGDPTTTPAIDLSVYRDDNIYTANGTLTGNRTVNMGGNDLDFDTVMYLDLSTRSIGAGAYADGNVTQSTFQGASDQANRGAVETPWIYAQSIEAVDEKGGAGTGIILGNDGNFNTGGDEITFVTDGNSYMRISPQTETQGMIRLDRYGAGTLASGPLTNLLGVDTDGDVIEVDPTSLGSDDQFDDEVPLRTPIDVDEGGESSPTNETNVQEVIQAIAPITSKAARIFYPPSIAVDASTNGTFTVNLYTEYIDQFGTPTVASAGAPGAVPTYGATELYYYVTFADPLVFDTTSTSGPTQMRIDANGVLTYTIIGQPADYNSLINVVFVVK